MRHCGRLSSRAVSLALLIGSAFAAPLIQTERTGYQAGETVVITGTGFSAQESVIVQVVHADGQAEPGRGHETREIVAGPDGSFTTEWKIDAYDHGSHEYVVNVTGATSGKGSTVLRRIAVISTDKFDYTPRSTALIVGSGFFPNDTVQLQVLHANGKNTGAGHLPFIANADSSGRITASWYVPADDSDKSILVLTAQGSSGLKANTIFFDPPLNVIDDAGPDDLNGQKDLTQLTVDYGNMPVILGMSWNWDDTSWSGNNTGDACALFDTNGNGRANYSLCVTVAGSPAVYQATKLYTCNDLNSDRCAGSVQVTTFSSTCMSAVPANSDPFRTIASHLSGNTCSATAGCYTADTVAACSVSMSDFGNASSVLPINVCSYPSQEPNSAPADCVVSPNNGFLTIRKVDQEIGDATTFTFNTSPASQGAGSQFTINGSGSVSLISYAPTASLSVSEVVPTNWQLDAAACAIGNTSTGSLSGSTVSSVQVSTGLETVCTFTNSLKKTRLTLAKSVTNDNGGSAAATDWTLSATGPTNIFGTTGSAAVTSAIVQPGSYTLSESGPAGYSASLFSCVKNGSPATSSNSITLAIGDTAVCTITNDDIAPKLTVTKLVTNDSGGTKQVADFTLKVNTTTVTSGVENTFSVGTYTVSEIAVAGYAATFSGDCDSNGSVTLTVGAVKSCTIRNDDIAPKLKVTKIVVNNSGGTKAVGDFTLKVDGNTVTSGVQNTLSAGPHTVSEVSDPGYAATIGGDCAADGSISLAVGDEKACTITNDDIAAKLTVTKYVINDNGGAKAVADFVLKVDATVVSSGVQNTFDAGLHNISEVAVAGYVGTIGGDCAADGTITLAPGSVKSCTITNDDVAPKLTVNKVVVNDNGGTKVIANFTLKVNGNTVTSGVQNTLSAGTYTVGEVADSGYTATITGDCAADGSITLVVGDVKTCTITNDDIPAKLTVTKVVKNDNGGALTVSDFTLKVDGATVQSGVQTTLNAGTHTVAEVAVTGYAGTISGDCAANGSITLAPGEVKACTITNDDIAPTLQLVKTVVNDNGGGAIASGWTLTATGPSVLSGAGGASGSVNAGTYTLAESTGPAGYSASPFSCVKNGGGAVLGNSISLAVGDSAVCTITNDDIGPKLTVTKYVTNDNGGTKTVSDFVLKVGSTTVQSGAQSTLSAGSYTVSEVAVPGYVGTIGGDCSSTGAITLALGDVKACTISNDDVAPTLQLIKSVINNNGGAAMASAWTLTATGPSQLSGAGGASGSVSAGNYTLSESAGPVGYSPSQFSCVKNGAGAVLGNSITLAVGDTAVCTITNDDIGPRLTVNKVVKNDNGGQKGVADFTLNVDGNVVTSGVQITLNAGSHIVSETKDNAYAATINGDCASDGTITLALGDVKTCTITNDDIAPKLKVTKIVVNNNGGTKNVSDFVLKVGTTTVTSGVQTAFNAGSYTVSEVNLPGYSATFNGDCSSTGAITLAPGDVKACTITNDDMPAKLTVIKQVINDHNGVLGVANFTLRVNGTAVVSGVQGTYNAGSYTVSEDAVSTYQGTINGDCAANGVIVLAVGDVKTCRITNNDIPAQITVQKVCAPTDDGGKFVLRVDNAGSSELPCGSSYGPIPVAAGTHTISEVAGSGTDLSNYITAIGGACSANGNVTVGLAQQVTCTITNTRKGRAQVVKTQNGGAVTFPAGQGFRFELRQGASTGVDGTTLAVGEANSTSATISFPTLLTPGATYNLCEVVLPGWSTTLPAPLFVPNLLDNSTVCTNFTVSPGQTRVFSVNNTYPGGMSRTIGFWKNWASCASSKGNQRPVLDQTLALGPIPVGDLTVSTCAVAIHILDKERIDSPFKKMSSDPAFNLAAQFLAASLNIQAQAGTCGKVVTNLTAAQALLAAVDFDGKTHKNMTPAQVNQANTLATALDQYNQDNSLFCSLP